jgi:hypothetical protein
VNDQLQGQTTLTAGTGVFVVAAILLLFLLPRKYAVVPFLLVSLFIPNGQLLIIGGLHFMIFRMMLPFAWLRVLMGQDGDETKRFQWNGIDKALLLWAVTDAVCSMLLWGSWDEVVGRMGFLYNVLGIYFLLRLWIRDREDVQRVLRTLAVACVFFAAFMIFEQETGRNAFSVFGGVSEFTAVREGKLRSQAAFATAIVAGTLGANLFPLFIGLWWQGGKSKLIAAAGAVSALLMLITSHSATPVGTCIVAIGALCMWSFRHNLKMFRWGLVACLVALQLVMKAPVWALIARFDVVNGNSGYHRYELINQAILHFGEWFFVGTKSTASWGDYMDDVADAYVTVAKEGGLLALLFFIGIFWQCFRRLGLARQAAERARDRKLELQVWSFGAALMATVVAYFGIYYFDQSQTVWWCLLAMVSAITSVALAGVPDTAKDTELTRPWAPRPAPVASPAGWEAPLAGSGSRLCPAPVSVERVPLSGAYRRPQR